jgi:hypothetical protein
MSSQILKILRLEEGSSLKISPFLASHGHQRIVSSTKGHSFASSWEGVLMFQTSSSFRLVTSQVLASPIVGAGFAGEENMVPIFHMIGTTLALFIVQDVLCVEV